MPSRPDPGFPDLGRDHRRYRPGIANAVLTQFMDFNTTPAKQTDGTVTMLRPSPTELKGKCRVLRIARLTTMGIDPKFPIASALPCVSWKLHPALTEELLVVPKKLVANGPIR